ncbi:hypothetical protein EJ03DRAFT_245254, partial [Teratosphaeria nubilosa]
GLATYNAILVILTVFLTFTRCRGLYFWSLLVAACGIVVSIYGGRLNALLGAKGHLIYLAFTISALGWWSMVTGQAFVLWSRLNLVLHGSRGFKLLKWTKWMIIANIALLHGPSTILFFCSFRGRRSQAFDIAYLIAEKIQLTGFFLQETMLSSIYIWKAIKILRSSLQVQTPALMKQLIAINAIIIFMDLVLIVLEYARFHSIQCLIKPLVYSIKLKLEFAILGKLKEV